MNAPVKNAVTQAPEATFQLGALRVDPRAGEACGPGGRERLDPKVMDVLVMLAQHTGQVVLREDLLARLWPNVVVTDEVLSRCIYELRRQLSQAGGSERYRELIETIPKRGYRLVGDVIRAPALRPAQPNTPSPASPPVRPRWRLPTLIAAAAAVALLVIVFGQRVTDTPAETHDLPAIAAAHSIAVLPFVDMSEGHDQGYLSDGISEEILNRLAQSGELRVIARTSSFALRDRSLGVAEIARKLNVTHVLEGSVRKAGDRIRVTAQLIAASDSSHVWSDTFDRGLDDVFSVQDEIARSVATALQVTLGGGSPQGPMPASVGAYENFLKGRFLFYRRAPGDVQRSVTYFKEATSIDARYAAAWAALAGAYSYLAWDGAHLDTDLQRLQGEAALKAVELDPRLAVAHSRLAQFYIETSDGKKADEHDRIASELDPDAPMVLFSASAAAIDAGDFDQAIAIQRRILTRDPLNPVYRQLLAVVLLADGRLDEAMSEYRSVLELNRDAGLDVEIEFVRISVLQGRDAEAYAAVTRMPEGKYRDHGLALLYRAPDHREEADAALARLLRQRSVTADSIVDGVMFEIRLAEVQAFRGMTDEAFATLESKKDALEQGRDSERPVVGYFQNEARLSPFLKALHSDPRWAPLVSATG
jgi:TolB-like protein/DNA-binding winged helix-turn-helix (wHTH) protein/predicted negative regulator of RcsB-dependent stress response